MNVIINELPELQTFYEQPVAKVFFRYRSWLSVFYDIRFMLRRIYYK